mgnify:CR=1 FL=1
MKYADNILQTIGNTPLVKLNNITNDVKALVLAKVESFNPGNSIKDRMALKMVEDAESDGRLMPGGTIVEGTSGNTGMGLALAAIVKGYKLICVSTDKQSKEKFDVLKAVGAKVIVCPTDVEADDPRSYYSTSKRIAEETPNSWYVNQYDNLSNTKALLEYLRNHDQVSWVNHPDLPDHDSHQMAKKYMPKGAGSIITFGVKGGRDAGKAFIENVKLASHLANVGDAKTLIIHPATTTHSRIDAEALIAAGITEDMVRISVGIEDVSDIQDDFNKGFRAAKKFC